MAQHWSIRKMSKRDAHIAQLKYAGYHDDSSTYTRLLIERPRSLSFDDANAAARAGATMRQNGMKCGCRECNK